MDIRDFLENHLTHLKKEEIIAIIGKEPNVEKELFDLSYSDDMPVAWRAMWLLDHLDETQPGIAEKYVDTIWREVPNGHPIGVLRSALRLLSRYDIPEEHQSMAIDLSLDWLTKESVAVAIKVYGMEMMNKMVHVYPELANEFIEILEEEAPRNSAGFKARAKRIIKQMEKL